MSIKCLREGNVTPLSWGLLGDTRITKTCRNAHNIFTYTNMKDVDNGYAIIEHVSYFTPCGSVYKIISFAQMYDRGADKTSTNSIYIFIDIVSDDIAFQYYYEDDFLNCFNIGGTDNDYSNDNYDYDYDYDYDYSDDDDSDDGPQLYPSVDTKIEYNIGVKSFWTCLGPTYYHNVDKPSFTSRYMTTRHGRVYLKNTIECYQHSRRTKLYDEPSIMQPFMPKQMLLSSAFDAPLYIFLTNL